MVKGDKQLKLENLAKDKRIKISFNVFEKQTYTFTNGKKRLNRIFLTLENGEEKGFSNMDNAITYINSL